MIKIIFPGTFHHLLLLFSICQVLVKSVASIDCQEKSQWGFSLEHSYYISLSTNDYPECLLYCLQDKSRCRSLTYDMMTKTCKLNSETRRSKPSKYGKKSYNIYMEMIGRDMSKTEAENKPTSSHIDSTMTAKSRHVVSSVMKTTALPVPETSSVTSNLPATHVTSSHSASVQPQSSLTANPSTVHSLVSIQASQMTDQLQTTQAITSQVTEAQISITEGSISVMPTSTQSTVLITQGTATASVSVASEQFDPSTFCIGKLKLPVIIYPSN